MFRQMRKRRKLSVYRAGLYFSGASRWIGFNVVERGTAVLCYHCSSVRSLVQW